MTTRHLHTRRYHKVFKNIAIWGYWDGAKKLPVGPEGAIAICSAPDGWFWGIPLHDGNLSVGLVIHKETFQAKRRKGTSYEQIYHEAIDECPVIADLLAPAEQVTALCIEQDYSYTVERFTGPGYFLVGDAACFLDPLLSTGVHFAMYSAMLAAASLASVLRGEVTEQEAEDHYEQTYRQSYLRLLVIVSSLYQRYRGKKSYFWEAQRLTLNDCGTTDLKQAFVSIVSGIEDLRDAQAMLDQTMKATGEILEETFTPPKNALDSMKSFDSMSSEEREIYQAKWQFIVLAMMGHLQSHSEAAQGLYLVTKPRLGLVHHGS